MQRRIFLKTSAFAAPAVASTFYGSTAQAQGFTQKAQQISEKIFANDGLSIPIATTPTVSPLAKGLDRTLVLGGGGEYYIAWYCGFFHGLLEAGLDMASLSQMVVGTSAGSYMGSSLLSGHFKRLRTEMDFFGEFPKIFAKLAPTTNPNTSQLRAMEINMSATDGSIETR